jgi:hypothetical protein
MFHSSGFAIAAGVVAVGAAAGSAAISMSAADRAKKGQGVAAAAFKRQQRKATKGLVKGQQEVQGMINEVKAPEYNLGAMIGDAGQISDYYRKQLETFQPGAAQQRQQAQGQIGQAMDVISSYLRGDIPQDVKDQITRNVAESAGAGFNPATAGRTGGFQAAQGQMARNLGLTSLDIQGRGLAAMPSVQKAKLTSDMFSNIYNAQSGLASQIYGANKENIAASYAAQQAVGQGVSDIGKATSGALMGVSNAYGQMGAAGAGGTTYGSSAAAQQAAPYAGSISQVQGMGYVPRAQATGRTYDPASQIYR